MTEQLDIEASPVRTIEAEWPQVGMRARWKGRSVAIPDGATSNPPPPGWVPLRPNPMDPPTDNIDGTIEEVQPYGRSASSRNYVTRLRADDGRLFDPSIDPDFLVPLVINPAPGGAGDGEA